VADVGSLRGVGAKTAPLFGELGVSTAAELLDYFPFRYDDLRFPVPARDLGTTGGEENAVGTIVALKERRVRDLEIVETTMRDDEGGSFSAKWIGRRRFIYGRLREGMRLYVRGRVERNLGHPTVNVSHYATLGSEEVYRGELVPVYRASKRLASRKIAAVIRNNFATLLETAGDRTASQLFTARGCVSRHPSPGRSATSRCGSRAFRFLGVSLVSDCRAAAQATPRARDRRARTARGSRLAGRVRGSLAVPVDRRAATRYS
jgi:ATP-dependent DNA helicase RecG